jgi:ketosteroid isomerase-like protein
MSGENVEVVRRIYHEFAARPETIRELYHPDFEMDLRDIPLDVGVVQGFERSVEALRGYIETFEDFHYELAEVIHADEEHVVTAVHDGGRLRGSDAEVRNLRFNAWTFLDSKVIRVSAHQDRTRALEAARLQE